jgi:hypothetical protein
MEKLKLLQRVQAELLNHDELLELRPRVKLSFDEEKFIVQYRHPFTGQAGSMVAGAVRDVQREEKRMTAEIVQRLRGRGRDKPFETLIRPET